MGVAVPGAGVLLRHSQLDRFAGAGVGAGQAGLTAAGNMLCPALHQPDGGGGADPLADAAADAVLAHPQEMLPGIRRGQAHPSQKRLVGCPVCLGNRGNPRHLLSHVGLDGGQLFLHMLVLALLLLHVKDGQTIVHHVDEVDVADGNAAAGTQFLGQLRRAPVAVAIGEDHVEIRRLEGGLLQKFLHHGRNLMAVNGGHDANPVVGKGQILPVHHLGDADGLALQPLGHVQAVAGTGKIE